MRHGSLFSGIGGFDLASEWMGWENVFHCEWNEFGRKVLKHYWPQSISYEDITKTDFTSHRDRIDILTGGFPCQPYSQAGKRKGKDDDRHLWPEMLRAIREIKPTWVVGENVRGLVNWNGGLVFDEVQSDLEAAGYEVQPFLLPACAVNAPHRRDRVWFIAVNTECQPNGKHYRGTSKGKGVDLERNIVVQEGRNEGTNHTFPTNNSGTTTNTNNTGTNKRVRSNGYGQEKNKGRQRQPQPKFREDGCNGNAANSECKRPPRKEHWKKESRQFTQADKGCGWQNFPTQSPICSGDDGFPNQLDGITFPKWRNESIKAYGNAIVPQVALQIFKAINKHETHESN